MFDRLSDGLTRVVQGLAGRGVSDSKIRNACRRVRRSLLEADVALETVTNIVNNIEARSFEHASAAAGGDQLIRIIREEITEALGTKSSGLNLSTAPSAILMAGLQGTGKTTTAAKLARHLIERKSMRVALATTDIYRPAAAEQLRVLSEEVGARFISGGQRKEPADIAAFALAEARRLSDDVLIVDTAGRLAIDAEMMAELGSIHARLKPVESLFVVDAMTGQDAATTAREFGKTVPLTGVVVSKIDGDARGGAALSVKHVTGKPIKFFGTGERTNALEVFHPERLASRLLGMGDLESLIEDADRNVDKQRASLVAGKVLGRQRLDFEDVRVQLEEMQKLGGMSAMLKQMPKLAGTKVKHVQDESYTKMVVIIDSMTVRERRFPDLLNPSRKRRIAAGSGTSIQDVNNLIRYLGQLRKQTRKMGRSGRKGRQMRRMAERIDAQFSDQGLESAQDLLNPR